jgi:hypothetical protein
MNEMSKRPTEPEPMNEFERSAQRAFAASVRELDAATRVRLVAARERALEKTGGVRSSLGWSWSLAPSATPPRAQSPKSAAPDLAFLEYLGSWQGNDDEWLAIKEWDQDSAPKDAAEKPQDSAAKPKEPAPQRAGNDHDKGQ